MHTLARPLTLRVRETLHRPTVVRGVRVYDLPIPLIEISGTLRKLKEMLKVSLNEEQLSKNRHILLQKQAVA